MNTEKQIEELKALFDLAELDKVLHLANQLISNPATIVWATFYKSKVLQFKQEWSQALLDLNFALHQYPNEALLLGERAVVYIQLKDWNASMDDFNKAVSLQPSNPYRYSSRAWLKGRLNDIDGAVQDYKTAIKLDPTDMIAYNNLGLLEEQLGKKDEAEARYAFADKLAGRKPTDWNQISKNVASFNENNQKSQTQQTENEQQFGNHTQTKWDIVKAIFLDKKMRKSFIDYLFRKG